MFLIMWEIKYHMVKNIIVKNVALTAGKIPYEGKKIFYHLSFVGVWGEFYRFNVYYNDTGIVFR